MSDTAPNPKITTTPSLGFSLSLKKINAKITVTSGLKFITIDTVVRVKYFKAA